MHQEKVAAGGTVSVPLLSQPAFRCFRSELAEGRQRPGLDQHSGEQVRGSGGVRHSGHRGIPTLVLRVSGRGNLPSVPSAASPSTEAGLAVLSSGDDGAQVGVPNHGRPSGLQTAMAAAAQQAEKSGPHLSA